MALSTVTLSPKSSLGFLVLSLFLGHVSSQSCASRYPTTCTCSVEVFSCTSANLTEFPSDLPNGGTLLTIDLSNNSITAIETDVLQAYPQLQTVSLIENGLTHITDQSLPANFTKIDLRRNPIDCNSNLAWLSGVTEVLGTCASGEEIQSFLESLEPTAGNPTIGPTQQTQPTADTKTQPTPTLAVGSTTQQPEPNRLYVLAIIIPVLVIVVICITVVICTIKRNRKQQEAYNSSIRYSVVRKDAGAGNRVYSDVTTEL